MMGIHTKHREWIEARGLDPQLAERLGLETVLNNGKAWLRIPYLEAGETINHKWRLTKDKGHMMDSGAPLLLWNADVLKSPEVTSGQAPVVITEGEWDAMAAIQAGHRFTVSVPNGAPSKETDDLDTAKRYDWVDRHAADLAKVKRFVIATDSDRAGQYLRADLVALLGADRCSFVEYPFKHKDLNEVLEHVGAAAVTECIEAAKPFPVQGLYQIDDIPERGPVRSYHIGVDPITDNIPIVPGTLTVLTGYANMGKSTLMDTITAQAMLNHFPVCVAAFETEVKPILRDDLLRAILRCDKNELPRHKKLEHAMQCLRERLHVITQLVDEDDEMDFERFLSLCEVAVKRGAKLIVLDPWNELEHKRGRDETETDYTGRTLRAARRFAKMHDVAFWIVAHPSKPTHGSKTRPGLYDISGSANWANKPDYGLTYHRPNPKENLATISITKVRKGFPGRKDDIDVKYDFRTSEFVAA